MVGDKVLNFVNRTGENCWVIPRHGIETFGRPLFDCMLATFLVPTASVLVTDVRFMDKFIEMIFNGSLKLRKRRRFIP